MKHYNVSLLILQARNNTNYYFQVQICEDITRQNFSSCMAPSPVNQIQVDNETDCVAAGQTLVSAWDENPYLDGVRLTYFHGDPVSNIAWRSSTIYFLCNTTGDGIPYFEHIRDCTDSPADGGLELGGIYHFYVNTKLAC